MNRTATKNFEERLKLLQEQNRSLNDTVRSKEKELEEKGAKWEERYGLVEEQLRGEV